MANCYLCNKQITENGFRKEVYTGHTSSFSVSKNVRVGKRNHFSMQLICSDCNNIVKHKWYDSWGWCIFWLFVLWPVGLYGIIKKLS